MNQIMKMPLKIALGIVAILPFPLAALMIGFFLYIVESNPINPVEAISSYAIYVNILSPFITLLLTGVQVYYVIHAARNPNVGDMRVTWILSILFLGPFVMPFYWFHHIWRDGAPAARSGHLGLD